MHGGCGKLHRICRDLRRLRQGRDTCFSCGRRLGFCVPRPRRRYSATAGRIRTGRRDAFVEWCDPAEIAHGIRVLGRDSIRIAGRRDAGKWRSCAACRRTCPAVRGSKFRTSSCGRSEVGYRTQVGIRADSFRFGNRPGL
jgi:hypothetical protein